MNTDALTWIVLAVVVATAVALVVSLLRVVLNDGYGVTRAPSSHRTDWGTSSLPSTPYAVR
jgi:hypothetical protein